MERTEKNKKKRKREVKKKGREERSLKGTDRRRNEWKTWKKIKSNRNSVL